MYPLSLFWYSGVLTITVHVPILPFQVPCQVTVPVLILPLQYPSYRFRFRARLPFLDPSSLFRYRVTCYWSCTRCSTTSCTRPTCLGTMLPVTVPVPIVLPLYVSVLPVQVLCYLLLLLYPLFYPCLYPPYLFRYRATCYCSCTRCSTPACTRPPPRNGARPTRPPGSARSGGFRSIGIMIKKKI